MLEEANSQNILLEAKPPPERELGELETPILLTCTLCVWKAADAMVGWMLDQNDMQNVRSLNAFVGCAHAGEHHRGTFLICRQCGTVLELAMPELNQAIESAARAEAFLPDDVTLEVAGLCPRCQGEQTND